MLIESTFKRLDGEKVDSPAATPHTNATYIINPAAHESILRRSVVSTEASDLVLIEWRTLSIPVQATVLMVVAMALFASMSVFIRLSAEALHPLVVVFFRNFLAVLLLAPWLFRRGLHVLRTNRLPLLAARSLINVVGMAAGFTAVTMIPLAEATALSFTAPLWTTIGAALVLGEVIRMRRIAALVIGFIGVVVVLRPGLEAVSAGSLLALTNALLLAFTAIIVKRLTTTETPEAIVAWMVVLQSPLSLGAALFFWGWPDLMGWVWLFCLAGAGTLGHICWTRAYSIVEVTQLQPLEFVRLPMVALLAFLVFAEIPTPWTWVGGTVIFCSTVYISYREAKLAQFRSANR